MKTCYSRLNSPSVVDFNPIFCCSRTTCAMFLSSTFLSSSALKLPAKNLARASFTSAGLSQDPTEVMR